MATRCQIPLRLAYGITIHKSQGMTLLNVTVFAPGQLSVALGRATTTDGFRVVGSDHTRHIIKAKPSVEAFNSHITVDTSIPSTTCCGNCTHHIPVQHMTSKDGKTPELSKDDSSDIDEDHFDELFHVPEIEDVVYHFLSQNAEQIIRNRIIPDNTQEEIISHPLLQEFMSAVWLKFSKL